MAIPKDIRDALKPSAAEIAADQGLTEDELRELVKD